VLIQQQSITFQKTAFFSDTAVRTSNLERVVSIMLWPGILWTAA
jgi:hypothetical protein